jgi:hypothetical protein
MPIRDQVPDPEAVADAAGERIYKTRLVTFDPSVRDLFSEWAQRYESQIRSLVVERGWEEADFVCAAMDILGRAADFAFESAGGPSKKLFANIAYEPAWRPVVTTEMCSAAFKERCPFYGC